MWGSAISAALKRLLRLDRMAFDHKSRQTSADACPTAVLMRQMHSPDVTHQSVLHGLPVTERAARWKLVKRLDENAALRRSVIEANRKELLATLKGGCSNG
jgi:hypothetical protein